MRNTFSTFLCVSVRNSWLARSFSSRVRKISLTLLTAGRIREPKLSASENCSSVSLRPWVKRSRPTASIYSFSSSLVKLILSSTQILGLMPLLKKRRWRARAFIVNAKAANSPARSSSSMPYKLWVRIFSGISL